jgi:hypothetical protein
MADRRRRAPLPEEGVGDEDVNTAMAEAILDDSDRRQADRDAAPGTFVEHRTSKQATPPPE